MAVDPSVIERTEPRQRSNRHEHVVCEFCDCRLSLRGRVLWRSDKAKAILDLDAEADTLRKQVETLTAEVARLKEQLAAAAAPEPPAPQPAKKQWRSIGDEE